MRDTKLIALAIHLQAANDANDLSSFNKHPIDCCNPALSNVASCDLFHSLHSTKLLDSLLLIFHFSSDQIALNDVFVQPFLLQL